jgi:type III pantothenate kinase
LYTIVVVDVGNSTTRFGVFTDSELVFSFSGPTTMILGCENPWDIINNQLYRFDSVLPQVAFVSSVVSQCDEPLKNAINKLWGLEPIFVDHKTKLGIEIGVEEPSLVGVDRLVNCAAIYGKSRNSAIVVDIGTAITWDVVSNDGIFLGGAIGAGPSLISEVLSKGTEKLPHLIVDSSFFPPAKAIGKNTHDAISSGLYFGFIGMMDGVIERMIKELGYTPSIVFTGGFAPLFGPVSKFENMVDPDLTLKGLSIIAKLNTPT